MKSYVRERHVFPIALPLAGLVFIALLTFSVSRILLAVSKNAASFIALLLSVNILMGAAFFAYAGERARKAQRFAVAFLGVAVIAAGITAGAVVGERPVEHHAASGEQGHGGEGGGSTDGGHGGGSGGGGAATEVEVVDSAFEPKTVTIKAGSAVTWTQTGSAPHNVVADDDSFNSHPDCMADTSKCMHQGDTYSHTFEEPGEYPYYCQLHGAAGGIGMAGTVVVEA